MRKFFEGVGVICTMLLFVLLVEAAIFGVPILVKACTQALG